MLFNLLINNYTKFKEIIIAFFNEIKGEKSI